MEISLRPATSVSLPDILEMMAEFNAIDDYPFDRTSRRRDLEHFLANRMLGRLWTIMLGQRIVGYLVLSFGFSFEYGGRDAFIDEFFIRERFRNQGIGSQVMPIVEGLAGKLGVKALHLEVEPHNVEGRRVYEKSGYRGNERILLSKRL